MARIGKFDLSLPVFGSPGTDGTDYRAVPASDRGNEGYADRGALGSYSPSEREYKSPSDIERFGGYGASTADLERGYVTPTIREEPAYDMENYFNRGSEPPYGNDDRFMQEGEFRDRNRQRKGFLRRTHLDEDRG